MNSGGPVGYGIPKVHGIEDTIRTKFEEVGGVIEKEWPNVRGTLRGEWVGPDEASYEKEFVKKINKLYGASKYTAEYCCAALEEWLKTWVDFQNTNKLDGAEDVKSLDESGQVGQDPYILLSEFKGTPETYESIEIVKFEEPKFESDFRGLTNGSSSKGVIEDSIESYVANIKSGIDGVFAEVKVDDAFYGSQVNSVNKVIEEASKAIVEINRAVQDLHDTLATLLNTNYGSVENSVSESANQASSSLDSSTDELAGKWNSK